MQRRTLLSRTMLKVTAAVAALSLMPFITAEAPAAAAPSAVSIFDLTANGRVEPLGIGTADPSFGWKLDAERRDVTQTAYEVRVGTAPESGNVWSSGRVNSDNQVSVSYDGPELESATRYFWSVRVWDDTDTVSEWSADTWFETGLESVSDWEDAQWVGRSSSAFETWRDYTTTVDFDLNNLAFGVFLRSQNPSNQYMWQLNVGGNADSVPSLVPHRMINGGWAALASINLTTFGFTRAQILDGDHSLRITANGTTITTFLDDIEIDERTDSTFSFGAVGIRTWGAESVTIRGISVVDSSNNDLARPLMTSNPFTGGTFSDGSVLVSGTTDAYLMAPEESAAPLLRTTFTTEPGKTIAAARVYASAHGVYELSLNGDKVGDQFLAPGYTEYVKRIQSQTYDVTDQIRAGENAFGAALGDGWWAGKVGLAGKYQYGTDLSVIARLRVDYTDGTSQWIDTNESWVWKPGPFVATDNQIGETYDARYARDGWNTTGFDASDWSPVVVRPSDTDKLSPQPDEPVRETERLTATGYTTPAAGVRIYDMGQNMVGVPRVTITGNAGDTVTIRHAEVLNPDGTMYTANLRAALSIDYYTFATDGTVTYQPTFTQHGFRYIEISGLDQLPSAAQVHGVVLGSDLPMTGDVTTSNALINQLVSNIRWSARGNFLSIPTDTPARDERLGWTGDINVFAPTAAYLFDTRSFLAKWMTDVRDEQKPSGSIPSVIPSTNGMFDETGVAWEDAIITVPHSIWAAYGDTQILRDNWDAMKKFFDYARASAGADNLEPGRATWFSADWLHLDDPSNQGVLGTAVWAQDVSMMADMAEALGKTAEAAEYRELYQDVREAFTNAYVAADGTVAGDSQTGYALALGKDLITDEALKVKAGERFVEKLARTDNHLRTGFVGAPWLLPALSEIGRDDIAFEMLLKETYPSWGYPITMGATTIWERWNSIQPDGSFGPVDMNSFNHYAYGAVGNWIREHIAGIRIGEPGYKTSVIEPTLGGGLTHGGGEIETVYGPLSSSWTSGSDGFELTVTVPAGTTSVVRIPSDNALSVLESGSLVALADGVHSVGYDDASSRTTVEIGSGTYHFTVSAAVAALAPATDAVNELRTAVVDASLSGSTRDALLARVDAAAEEITEAIAATIGGEDAFGALARAAAELAAFESTLAASDADDDTRDSLAEHLAAARTAVTEALLVARSITYELIPNPATSGRGELLDVTISVRNDGIERVDAVTGTVAVLGRTVHSDAAAIGTGASRDLDFAIDMPSTARIGVSDAQLALTFTIDEVDYPINRTLVDWLTIASRISIDPVSVSGVDNAAATVTATITNTGTVPMTGRLSVAGPSGWPTNAASGTVTVAPGASTEVTARVLVPLTASVGDNRLVVRFGTDDSTFATVLANLTVAPLTVPDDASMVVDHVDFGESSSELAHDVTASASSGTSLEAGLTRRYSNNNTPGSWFEATVGVEPGQPIVLRLRETWYSPGQKEYDVFVDGTLVQQVSLTRSGGSGQTSVIHQIVVDDPDLLTESTTVRVRFQYRSTLAPQQYYDPSIADLWSLSGTDRTAPSLSAWIDAAESPNAAGWYTTPVTVRLDAADNRAGEIAVERSVNGEWHDTTSSIDVNDDGEHEYRFRAIDAVGNISAEAVANVRIDSAPPVTTTTLSPDSGIVDDGETVTVSFDVTDATSGHEATHYSLDEGETWATLDGTQLSFSALGVHRVTYRSVDAAGNVEEPQLVVVEVRVVDPAHSVRVDVGAGIVAQGRSLPVTVSGLQPGQQIAATLFSDPIVVTGIPPAGLDGTTTFSVQVPVDLAPGAHTLVIEGATAEPISIPITVVAAPADAGEGEGQLSHTGGDVPYAFLLIAVLLLIAGAVLIIRRRSA